MGFVVGCEGGDLLSPVGSSRSRLPRIRCQQGLATGISIKSGKLRKSDSNLIEDKDRNEKVKR